MDEIFLLLEMILQIKSKNYFQIFRMKMNYYKNLYFE
jgi:hypothetical protein